MPLPRRARDALTSGAVVGLAVTFDLVVWGGDRELRDHRRLPLLVVPVAVLLVHTTLLLRRSGPRLVFAVECGFALVASLAVPDLQPFAGLLFAVHALSSRRPPRESALWLVAVAVPFGLHSYNTNAAKTTDQVRSFILLLLSWLLVSAAVWGAGRVAYASAQRSWRLQELQAAEAAEAVLDERARLARELHDIVSHAVIGMTLQAAGAQALLQPEDDRVRRSLATIEATGVQAMSELHRMLGLLRPGDPHAPPGAAGPTIADLSALVELAEAAGRTVQLVQEGTPGALDQSVETAAYRIVQEGLTNSAKHAGPEAAVTVRLDWREEQLELVVRDRQRGPTLPPDRRTALSSGAGLRGLGERVALIGGTLEAGPTDDGYALVARLPRPRPAAAVLAGVDARR